MSLLTSTIDVADLTKYLTKSAADTYADPDRVDVRYEAHIDRLPMSWPRTVSPVSCGSLRSGIFGLVVPVWFPASQPGGRSRRPTLASNGASPAGLRVGSVGRADSVLVQDIGDRCLKT
jgi:hypothetical protein